MWFWIAVASFLIVGSLVSWYRSRGAYQLRGDHESRARQVEGRVQSYRMPEDGPASTFW